MRDRLAERRVARLVGIDMDELEVPRSPGEAVDTFLIDQQPVRDADVGAAQRQKLVLGQVS